MHALLLEYKLEPELQQTLFFSYFAILFWSFFMCFIYFQSIYMENM